MNANLSRRWFLKGALASSVAALAPFAMAEQAEAAVAIDAIRKALAGDFSEAGSLARRSGDPSAVKLVELIYLQKHGKQVGFARIRDFQQAAPKWPLSETLHKRAEQALFYSHEPSATVISYFDGRAPLTADGHAALARAFFEAGQDKEGRAALRQAWSATSIDADIEKRIAFEFSSKLTAADHKYRLSRLIFAQESNAALRHAKRLGSEQMRVAQVAQLLLRGTAGAEKKYGALPASLRGEPSLHYALARFYRRQEKFGKARGILLDAPDSTAGMIDPSAWWQERRIIARRSIGPSHRSTLKEGYKIASSHGLSEGDDYVDAEFLSGWIALRYLKDANRAFSHFSNVKEAASNRTEKARGGYWLGRAHAALGDKAAATAAYKSAAQHSTLYYGQLAREQIGMGKVPEEIISGEASSAARAKVDQDEVIRAMRLMYKAAGKEQCHMFLWSIASRFKTVDEMNAAADAVHDMGGTFMSLKLAKVAAQFKVDIDSWAYPVRGLPDWKQIGKPVEKALVFGLSRQESEFNPQAGSKAGAQGLMQLMPGTAKIIAKQYRIPYAQAKLKGDPAYNVKLGAAHLADLVEDFGGSYVLTLVAYNAGPRRAREWVAEYGDPRAGQVDAIDWVESIPFMETRQYVQKVLQNVHVYRSRLAPKTVRPMTADLKRGAPGSITVASTSEPTPQPASCSGTSIAALITGCD